MGGWKGCVGYFEGLMARMGLWRWGGVRVVVGLFVVSGRCPLGHVGFVRARVCVCSVRGEQWVML